MRPRWAEPDGLSTQARALHADVVSRSGRVDEQLMLLLTLARNYAASSADVAAVRELLLSGQLRECGR